MAGTTYRGLTIRIGAETTQFTAGLSRINAAAAATTTKLRRIKSALQLDPGNVSAMSQQLGGMASLAAQTQAKVSRLNEEIRELSRQRLSSGDGTVGELARDTQDAQAEAQRLREAYQAVTTELASTYNAIERITGVKIDTESLTEGTKGYADNVKKLDEYLSQYGKTSGDVTLSTEALVDEFVSLTKYEEDGSRVTSEMADHVKALRANFDETATAMGEMGRAAQLQDAQSELAQLNAQAKSLARELVTADKSSSFAKTSSEARSASESIRVLDAALKVVDDRLAQVDAALRLDPENVTLAAQRTQLLAERESIAAQRAEQLRAKISAYDAAGIGRVASETGEASVALEKAKEAAAKAQEKVAALSGELRELSMRQKDMDVQDVDKSSDAYVELATRVKVVKAALESAQSQARETGEAFDTAKAVDEYKQLQVELEETKAKAKEAAETASGTGSLRSIGYGLYTTVTPFLTRIGSAAIDAAETVDSAYRDMRKTVDGTESQFKQLRDAAVEFSETHVTSASQILEIEAMGGQLGVSADKLQGFAEVISNLDIATDIDAETAAQEVGQLANIMDDLQDATGKMDVGKVSQFSDALVRLGNNEPAMESDIMDVTMRIAGMGNIVGMSTPQLLAWSTAVVATGQDSEAAGTAISKTMSNIETAVGSGGDKLEKFAEVSGMSVEQFKRSWDADASGTMLAFVEGLKSIDESGGSVDSTLQELGITSVRQKQALEGLSQTTDVLNDSLSQSSSAWSSGGDAAEEARKKAEGFSGAMQILSNNAEAAGSELAESVAPIVSGVAGAIGELTGSFSKLPSGVKTALVAVGGIAAAAGPAIVAFSALSDGIGKLKASTGLVGTAMRKVSSGIGSLATSMGVSAGAAGILVAALAGVAAVAATQVASTIEAKREHERFLDTLGETGPISRATGVVDDFSGTIENAGEVAHASSESVDDFRDSMTEYVESQRGVLEDYQGQVATLSTAEGIIDSFAGKTELTASEQAKLEWAIDQVNEKLGLNIDKTNVASDSYEDADGNVVNLTDSLSDLIQKKKEEARVNALQEGLTNAYKAQADATNQLTAAQQEYNDKVKERTEYLLEQGWSQDEATISAQRWAGEQDDLNTKISEAEAALDSANGDIEAYASQMDNATEATKKSDDAFVNLIDSIGTFPATILEGNGQSVQRLADELRNMGATTDDLSKLTESDWRVIAQEYDGGADSIAGSLFEAGVSIDKYNGIDLMDKEASAEVVDTELTDAQGNVYTWNGTELLDKSNEVVVDDVQLVDSQGRVLTWNGTKFDSKQASANVSGNAVDGSAQRNIDTANSSITNLKRQDGATASVRVQTYGLSDLGALTSSLSSFATSFAGKTFSARTSVSANAAGGIRLNAAGGVRYHADGAIATKAVPLDIVGEAGAEAIVPLTNRRYSQPFIDLIADGVANKVGMGGTTVVNNVYFDGVRINDAPQIRDVTNDYMMDLTRKAGMYR